MIRSLLRALLFVSLVLTAACAEDDTSTPCSGDSQCPSGTICINDACVIQACGSAADCPGGNQSCVDGVCTAVQCGLPSSQTTTKQIYELCTNNGCGPGVAAGSLIDLAGLL